MSLEVIAAEGFADLADQEKTALDYLQKNIKGSGYLIPSLMVGREISNREIDAILILPDMLVLIELKHYRNRKIQIDSLSAPILRYRDDGSVGRNDNPCRNLAYSAKVLSSLTRKAGVRRIPTFGMLIFTHEQLRELVVQSQVIHSPGWDRLPNLQPQSRKERTTYKFLGGVTVCRLAAAPEALEAFRGKQDRPPVQLSSAERKQLKNTILGQMTPLPPEKRLRIESYVVDKELVDGEQDYRLKIGHEARTDMPVWIKEYQRNILSLDPNADTELLLRGAMALSNLGAHPNLLTYQAYFEIGDRIYIILKREPGHFLRDLMETGNLSLRDKLHVLRDILAGLSHIHSHQEGTRTALYRDLRPESVFVAQKGRAQLFNFDCTRLPSRITALTKARGRAQRWRAYASFELLNAQLPEQVDTPTDIYSWGVVAYEVLTGQLPYPDEKKAAQKQLKPLAEFELTIPPALQNLTEQALSQAPGERPPIAQLQIAVQEAIDDL